MVGYTTYGKLQTELKNYFLKTGTKLQFTEMTNRMAELGMLTDIPAEFKIPRNFETMDEDEFEEIINKIPMQLTSHIGSPMQKKVSEDTIIPNASDVFTIRHPRYTRRFSHKHNYFEVNYVAKGNGTFIFEDENHVMQEGELCIIAPGSTHDFIIEDDSTVYTLCIRKSSFDTAFFPLISRQDLLSYFFRQILKGTDRSNYLLFFSGNGYGMRAMLHRLLIESIRTDNYSNTCCNAIVNLIFTELMRNYSKTVRFYNYEMGSDFSLVLQYIQHNYQSLTLSSLANFFHYSEPYLCNLIKQNTGFTFTELMKRLRLKDAVSYLENTDIKISEIAELVGYNSADHFSRVFRNEYKMSPLAYRKKQQVDNSFVPFSTE